MSTGWEKLDNQFNIMCELDRTGIERRTPLAALNINHWAMGPTLAGYCADDSTGRLCWIHWNIWDKDEWRLLLSPEIYKKYICLICPWRYSCRIDWYIVVTTPILIQFVHFNSFTISRRVTHYCVVDCLKLLHTSDIVWGNMSSRFYSNSEADASELKENH